jgi:hypothetical protein
LAFLWFSGLDLHNHLDQQHSASSIDALFEDINTIILLALLLNTVLNATSRAISLSIIADSPIHF